MSDELTIRQIQFISYWLNPKSDTFGNAYASAIKANYSEEYAKVLASRDLEWLSDNVKRKKKLVEKAETNLENLLDAEDEKVKADLTKFTLSRLKKEDYSERSELTGKDGEKLVPTPILANVLSNGSNQEGNEPEEKA